MLDVTRPDDAHIDERLRTELIAWLATTTRGNRPHAVPVWFAWRDPHIVVFSLLSTRKVQDLQRQPECTLALESAEVGTDVVIVDGRATLPTLDDADVRAAMDVFEAKYRAMISEGFESWLEGFPQPILIDVERITAWNKSGEELAYRVVRR